LDQHELWEFDEAGTTLPVSRIGRMIGASNRLAGMVSVPEVAPV
jgi:hypothetical protein